MSNSAFPPEQADIHIAFGISADFTYPVGVLITFILENNRDLKIAFHIFIDDAIALEENKKSMTFYNTLIIFIGFTKLWYVRGFYSLHGVFVNTGKNFLEKIQILIRTY